MSKWRDYLDPHDVPDLADFPEPGDDPDVPKAMGVLFGAQVGWSPARENQSPGGCAICGNGQPNTPIQPGSRHYCAGCGRYGLDRQIGQLLKEHPAPKPDEMPRPSDLDASEAVARGTQKAFDEIARGQITVPDRFAHLIAKD